MRITLPLMLLAVAVPANAAERRFTVTDFDRIRIDGPFNVKLTTSSSPFARANAPSQNSLDRVAMEVQGRTLVIRSDRSAWGGYPGQKQEAVEISVGTHALTSAWVNGAGAIAIDRVRGLKFDLAVDGPGLGSIGKADVDDLRIRFAGAASGQVSGKALKLTIFVRGASSLEAGDLTAKDATITAEGPASVKATVTGTAKVDAQGTAAIELAGTPACTSRINGSASINGCK